MTNNMQFSTLKIPNSSVTKRFGEITPIGQNIMSSLGFYGQSSVCQIFSVVKGHLKLILPSGHTVYNLLWNDLN